jgi:hypothetical protein
MASKAGYLESEELSGVVSVLTLKTSASTTMAW